MNAQALKSNADLFSYLNGLADTLRQCDQIKLSENILRASKFSSGSPSEFLHEAYDALKTVELVSSLLSPDQREKLLAVMGQLSSAFRLIGGA